jgi:hypothetical protein
MCKINKILVSILILIALFSSCKDTAVEKTEEEKTNLGIKDTLKKSKKIISIEPILQLEIPLNFKNKNCEYNSKIDSTFLFKAWAIDLKDPSASFQISSNDFFAVDFNGIGERSYILKNKNIKISEGKYNDEGEIVKLTKDSLYIKWKSAGSTMKYIEWKDIE